MSTHVLVGFDESRQADAALDHALRRFPEATITVVHVNDPTEWIVEDADDEGGGFYAERSREQVTAAAERVLEEAEGIAADHDREVRTEVLTGRPARELVRFVEDEGVDHVVVGSHGRRGLARFLLGSVSERIVERSPVSVTVMRTPAADE